MDNGVIQAHSDKQERAFFSEKKITACITGIQWGKTTAGAVWIRHRVFENLSPDASFLVTAPTYKIMEQSTLPAFLREVGGYGTFNRQRAVFEVDCNMDDRNPKIYFRTAKEPDSVVGMTNVYGIWCDEAGKYPLYFWENIQGRSAFKDCPIIITTSPYSMNWIYRELIKPAREGKRDDVLVIQASSDENPFFPKSVYERNKVTMDPRRFRMLYDGNFDRMQGLVYDCFDERENQCEAFKLPQGTRFYAGIDWGFTEPFVMKIRAITLSGHHYGISEFYKSGLTPSVLMHLIGQKCQIFGIKVCYCDPSQPGLIEELNRYLAKHKIKSSAQPANNDITRGVGLHYELLASRRLKYFSNLNPHTLDEIETYHYPEPDDLGPDDHAKEQKPVGQDDHALDAERYVTISTYVIAKSLQPHVPEERKGHETNFDRIERLKKPKKSGQTETWG